MIRRIFSGVFPALRSRGSGQGYQHISPAQAKAMMDQQPDAIILDVREADEYVNGHIPGAVLLPVGSIDRDTAQRVIGGLDRVVLVYCRSGARSRMAAQVLAELGYSKIHEFGGILSWPYEVE